MATNTKTLARMYKLSLYSAIISWIIAGITVTGTYWYLLTEKTKYHVVAIDPFGRVSVIPDVVEVKTYPKQASERFVINFIERMRRISSDKQILIQDIKATNSVIKKGSSAEATYRAYELDSEQGGRDVLYNSVTRSVDILRVEEKTGGWLVEWMEASYDYSSGRPQKEVRFQATLTVIRGDVSNTTLLEINPLGFFIENFDILRVTERLIEAPSNDG